MKNLGILGGMLGAALVTIVACSSSSNTPGGASSSCIASLEGSGTETSACTTCMNSSCGDQITAASNSCSTYFSCVCPNGTYSASAVESSTCVADLQQAGCSTAFTNVDACQTQKCDSQCNGTSGGGSGSGSGSGSSSGGSSSGSDSGSGSSLSAACQSFETCCEAYMTANPSDIPSGQTAHSTCEYDAQNTSFGGDDACNELKATYAADGGPASCQ